MPIGRFAGRFAGRGGAAHPLRAGSLETAPAIAMSAPVHATVSSDLAVRERDAR